MKKFLLLAAAVLMAVFSGNAQETSIDAKSMGPLKVGMKLKNIPASQPGVYDSTEAFDDGGGMTLRMGGKDVILVLGEPAVETIILQDAGTALRTADGVFIGMPAKDFFALPGWTEIQSDNAMGQYYERDGVTAVVSLDLTPAGQRRFEDGGIPRQQDFSDKAFIEQIFIGDFEMED